MGRHSAPPSHWRRRRLHIEHWTFYILHELWLRTLPILLLFTLGPCGRVFFWHGWLVGWLDVMHPHPLIWFKLCTFPARCAAFYSLSLSRALSLSLSEEGCILSFVCVFTHMHPSWCTAASWHCLACYHMHRGFVTLPCMLPHARVCCWVHAATPQQSSIRNTLKRKYEQIPQISSSSPFDMTKPFTL